MGNYKIKILLRTIYYLWIERTKRKLYLYRILLRTKTINQLAL